MAATTASSSSESASTMAAAAAAPADRGLDASTLGATVLMDCLNDERLVNRIRTSKILLVGAGGIGCEVIKNLLLLGFRNINMIDLDTIDVSNLNRQFLFNRSHVGQSKAMVAARVAVKRFGHIEPQSEGIGGGVEVNPIHNSIQSQEYDVAFYEGHDLVINALDNIAARSHVNRMCLAANVTLVESGSAGYFGQAYVIRKGLSKCFECDPQQEKKQYASCTIRNTPSMPIHTIVWGKHLFAQLFGEEDPDNDVSPDMNDPELANDSAKENQRPAASESEPVNGTPNGDVNGLVNSTPQPKPPSTREWAKSKNYDPQALFEKLFRVDIEYLLKMDKLWENRRRPKPLNLDSILDGVEDANIAETSSLQVSNGPESGDQKGLKDQKLWSLKECYEKFAESVSHLHQKLLNEATKVNGENEEGDKKEAFLVWDKDDDDALNFVTAVSNLRSHCFSIERKSRFDVKSMAGNIIAAISSTNSIVGGLIALQALKILKQMMNSDLEQLGEDSQAKKRLFDATCKHAYLRKVNNVYSKLVSSYECDPPNPQCFVCSQSMPLITVSCNLAEALMYDLVEQLLISKLFFVSPDVYLEGRPTILWSKEDADEEDDEEERQRLRKRPLSQFPDVRSGTRLKIDDQLQNHSILIELIDEKVDPNANNGLWYKLTVKSGSLAAPNQDDVPSADGEKSEKVPNESSSDLPIASQKVSVIKEAVISSEAVSNNDTDHQPDVIQIEDSDNEDINDDDDGIVFIENSPSSSLPSSIPLVHTVDDESQGTSRSTEDMGANGKASEGDDSDVVEVEVIHGKRPIDRLKASPVHSNDGQTSPSESPVPKKSRIESDNGEIANKTVHSES